MTRKFVTITVLFLALAISALVGCSTSDQNFVAQKAVAQQSFDALKTGDWATYSGLMHPDALDEFRSMIAPIIEAAVPLDSVGNPSDSFPLLGQWRMSGPFLAQPADSFLVDIMNTIFDVSPELRQSFQGFQNNILGGVAEGSELTHLVIHTDMVLGGQAVSEKNVFTLKLVDGNWRSLLTAQIRGMAQLTVQALTYNGAAGR